MRFNRALPLLPLLLAACASPEGEYPSLEIRAAERTTGTFEPIPPTPYVPSATPAAVVDRLGRLEADAASAHRAFLAEAPAARRAVAAANGAETGSDAWSSATLASCDRLRLSTSTTGSVTSSAFARRLRRWRA